MKLRPALVLCLMLCWLPPAEGADAHVVKGSPVPVQISGGSEGMLASLDEVIEQQIALSGDKTASGALADDLAFFVRRHYLSQGWLSATVTWTLEQDAILLTVTEGVQQHVGATTFPGNPGLSEEELRRYLLRPTRERVGRFVKETPFVEPEITAGKDLVHRYVLSQGYADAAVDEAVPAMRDGGVVDLQVTIRPGIQWHVGRVTLNDMPSAVEEVVRLPARALQGQPLNEARVESFRRQIEGEVQSLGYFAGKVTSHSTRAGGQLMDLVFTAVPGPLHRVEKIEIDPAFSHGATRLLRSAFRPAVGHVYDAKRMELAYGRIVDTGLFEHLEMEPEAAGENALALAFSGEEAKRSSVGISGGFDTFLGAILGLEYKNVNFWDSGGMVRVKVTATQLGYLAGVQWKNPAIFSTPYALAVDLMPESFAFEGYTRQTGGLRVALSRDFTRHFSAEIHAGVSVNTVSSDTLTALELGPDDYDLGTAGLTLTYEARDNPVSPTRGWFMSAAVQGGYVSTALQEVSYTRTEFAASWYVPLSGKWRSAIGAHFGSLITGEDVGYVPIELRSYNGGAKSVRSFAERELGPRAHDGTPLGGTQTQTVSGEVSYEIAKNLELAAFVDAGSLTTEKGSVLPKFDDIRYAAGVGLRYRLPFGPLRVDYGVNLDRRTGEDRGALHIGFGFAF